MFWGTLTKIEAFDDQFGNGSIGAFVAHGVLHLPDKRRPAHFEYATDWADNGADGIKTSELNVQEGWALDVLSAREFLAVKCQLFDLCWSFDDGKHSADELDLPRRLVFTVTDEQIAAVGKAA